ncbi:hypothetical protein RN001_014858 [Aquatica leii]|uniref:G domain-containing protein n=1 Tax=Aquatica leii TaxID=1421715 RepID=A0AAN7NYI5_9COLE|nr:hypothetical protein RN001_014858 [Aquatica leii]
MNPKYNSQENSDSIDSMFKNLKISKEKKDINILLLGETGVGKSTFINAFLNYVSFSSLSEAKNENLHVVIPSQFSITDDSYEERVITIGNDHNESMEIGASATQGCRSYVYPIQGTGFRIRFIDTPGIGDTRGIDQDNVNFENVLSFIGELKYLNAICILLKPNNSRLTVMFEFCIKQLLSRLEKSASENLIFVFTNTRGTSYRPGETLVSLKKLLDGVKGVNIRCDRRNIFCADNESFRFLAALKNKVQFSAMDVDNFSHSWRQSYEECLRMIKYIVGDDDNPGLIPHEVKNSISVNEARRLVVQLSQPLAEITQLIQDNIRAVDAHRQRLKNSNITLTKLRSQLYIPIIDLKVVKLNEPITVCTSVKCSKVYEVGGKKKWHYSQKCHHPCYLKNVPKEIIGAPELSSCAAMKTNGECVLCSCRYQVHMHVYYETETFEKKLEDEFVKTKIMTEQQASRSVQTLTSNLSNRFTKLIEEKDTITKTTAKFACFLKTNAITPYNDAYEAYLQYLIDREKSMGETADQDLIKQIQKMLLEYSQEKNTILKAMSQARTTNSQITADDIINSVQCLYSLEIYGAKIKELVKAQSCARKDENKSQKKEFIFEVKRRREQCPPNVPQNYRPNPVLAPQFFPNLVFNQDGAGRIQMKVYPSHTGIAYNAPQMHNMTYSNHFNTPPHPQFLMNYQPPISSNAAINTKSKPRQSARSAGNAKNTKPQPYSSKPEQHSNPAKTTRKHNLNVSSSSSDEADVYYSSTERHRK